MGREVAMNAPQKRDGSVPHAEDRTAALAQWVAEFTPDRLAPADLAQLRTLLIDNAGVTLRGMALPWGQALTAYARPYRGQGQCRIFGTPLAVPPNVAGLVNATAAHGMELDDTHDESITHPGAVVIATALAVGTSEHRSGAEVLAAIAAGYEVMARVGMATGAGHVLEHGWHPTALFGGFGAAATASRLMDLDADGLMDAWGLMLSMAGGSMQFSQDPARTTVKRLHGGYGAHNGIMAAQLAGHGIAGPRQAFDGLYGLCRIFGARPDLDRLAPGRDEALQIHRISLKPYPCCRLFHSTIDALRDVTGGFALPPERIARLTIGGPDALLTQHMITRPTSMMAAQYSLPFTLGAALVHGPASYDAFAEDRLGDPAVLALADRVQAQADARMQAAFPAHFGSWVELETEDGDRRRAEILDSYGTTTNPMPRSAVAEKCAGLAGGGLPGFDMTAFLDVVDGLDRAPGIAGLVDLFATSSQ